MLEICGETTEPSNIGHTSQQIEVTHCVKLNLYLKKKYDTIYEIVMEVKGNITGPWNIDYTDLTLKAPITTAAAGTRSTVGRAPDS